MEPRQNYHGKCIVYLLRHGDSRQDDVRRFIGQTDIRLNEAGRVLPAFGRIIQNAGDGNVLIAGHAGVNRVILSNVLGMPLDNLFRLGQDFGCLNIIVCGSDSARLRTMNILPKTIY